MTKKLMMVAACAATVLLGSGIAQADPAPAPGPTNGPKCWVTATMMGIQQFTPCGWAYTDSKGWYQVPWGFHGHVISRALRLNPFGRRNRPAT